MNYTVQASTNLTDWATLPGATTGMGESLQTTVTNTAALAPFFLRLQAER